ncbi:hypothetical protein JCM8097_007035 [Rhodosporidiobolus ruineniae]
MQMLPNTFNAPTMDPFEALAVNKDDDKPPPPPAVIRPFKQQTDLKLVRYLVGSSVMEPSSLANQHALFSPIGVVLTLALSHFLILRFGGYPAALHDLVSSSPKPFNPEANVLQTVSDFLILVPVLVGPPIALLALFEFRHRNLFEDEMRRAIGEEDLRDIKGYYAVEDVSSAKAKKGKAAAARKTEQDKPASTDGQQQQQRKGFWVLEYDHRLIGAVALDGLKPGQKLDSAIDHVGAAAAAKAVKKEEAGSLTVPTSEGEGESTATEAKEGDKGYSLRSRSAGKSTPSLSVTPPTPSSGTAPSSFSLDSASALPSGTLHLRRFATSLSFRSAGIEDDLLDFVERRAFAPSSSLSSSSGGESDAPEPADQLVLALRPSVQRSLRRRLQQRGWTLVPAGSELDIASSSRGSVLDYVWPLSLKERTLVLRRSAWEARQK